MLILIGLRISEDSHKLGGLTVPTGAAFDAGEYWERIDFTGNITDAEDILRQLGAIEVRRELFGCEECLIIIYAFSDRLTGRTYERWGTFNIMIAVRNGSIAVGYPVLIGSF